MYVHTLPLPNLRWLQWAMDTAINPLDEKQQVFHSLTQILPET